MKKWKRVSAGALSICMLATCTPYLAEAGGILQTPVTAHAETNDDIITGKCGLNATWNYNKTTKIMTISGTGFATSSIKKCNYTKDMKQLIFSEEIKGVDSGAFQNCTALEDIQFGGVKEIRRSAFAGCTALKSLDFNRNTKRIRDYVFKGCTSLESLHLGGNLEEIGVEAFADCKNLTTVTVGSKVKTVYQDIFKGCDNLTSIAIDKKNTHLYADGKKLLISKFSGTCGKNVKYSYNARTKTLTLSGSGPMENGTHYFDGDCGTDSYYNCFPALYDNVIKHHMQTLIVGDKITSIGTCAFSQCDALKTVKLGKNVSTIGSYAFIGCSALKTIQSGNKIKKIGKKAFSECSKLTNIGTLTNLTKIGDYAFSECQKLKTFSIGKAVKSIGEGAFSQCASLSKLNVHKNNKYFSKRDNMLLNKSQSKLVSACFGSNKTCNIYDSVKQIDKILLEDTSIKSFSVNKKNSKYESKDGLLYSKDGKTLKRCPRGLSGVVNIDDTVTTMDTGAFNNCNKITQINIGENMETIPIGSNGISAEKLNNIQISADNAYFYEANGSLIKKANDELLYCYKMDGDTYTIPDSVKKIGTYAFCTQSNLKTLIIPNTIDFEHSSFLFYEDGLYPTSYVEKIQLGQNYNGSFKYFINFSKLKELTVSSENPTYSSIDGVLYNKEGNTLIYLPEALETYTIPEGVTSIDHTYLDSALLSLDHLTISNTITDATDWLSLFSFVESLHIGKNVNTLKINMRFLKNISVDEENSTFKSVNNMLYSKDGSKFILCPAQTEGTVELEKGVTEISEYAFSNCTKITEIVIPETVSKINDYALGDPTSNHIFSIDYTISVPKGKIDYYKSLFTEKTGFISNMVIKEANN